MTDQVHLVLTPVRSDRAEDFDRFLADVVTPAVRAHRPDLEGRWRVLRSVRSTEGMVTYAFLFEGGSLADDWELDKLLPPQLGEEEAARVIAEAVGTFGSLEEWAATATARSESNQITLTMEPRDFG